MLSESRPQSNAPESSPSAKGRGGDTSATLFFPGRGQCAEFFKRRNSLSRRADPRLELLPVLSRNGDDRAAQHIDLRRLQSLPAHEFAQRRPRLLRSRFQNGPFVGIDPNAEYRCCGRILHVYDNSIHAEKNQCSQRQPEISDISRLPDISGMHWRNRPTEESRL